jgi:hypothetical protein
LELQRSDIEAIASLPLLRCLKIRGEVTADAFVPLARCLKLIHLELERPCRIILVGSLPPNLLKLSLPNPSRAVIDEIIRDFPKLTHLVIQFLNADELAERDEIVQLLKNGLKKLAKLIVNKPIQLGTRRDVLRFLLVISYSNVSFQRSLGT